MVLKQPLEFRPFRAVCIHGTTGIGIYNDISDFALL